jgi:transcription elongation factor Elf1
MDSPQTVLGVNGANGKPLHLCPNCNAYIIAATLSERVSDRCVRNTWFCEVCGFEFETAATFLVKRTSN